MIAIFIKAIGVFLGVAVVGGLGFFAVCAWLGWREEQQELAAWAESISEHVRNSPQHGISQRARQQIRNQVMNGGDPQ